MTDSTTPETNAEATVKTKPKSSSQNGFLSILINIVVPVFILNKGHKYGLTPQFSVIFALCFPLFYGIYSTVKEKKINFISLLGLLNILVSGTLTLLALGGIWFAIKEAAFPLLIGIFVFISSVTKKPLFESLFLNPDAFNIEKIKGALDSDEKKLTFHVLMQKATRWLSLSFLMSAILNFVLAVRIFKPIDQSLSTEQQQQILNEQLSHMTLYANLIILIPSMIFLGLILYISIQKIKEITHLQTEELFHQ